MFVSLVAAFRALLVVVIVSVALINICVQRFLGFGLIACFMCWVILFALFLFLFYCCFQ